MALTIEELMIPRYKVISLYPECERHNFKKLGDILTDDGKTAVRNQDGKPIVPIDWDLFPAIFQKLEWWQDRQEIELPNYVSQYGEFFKVQEWHVNLAPKVSVYINPKIHSGFMPDTTETPLYGDIFPATEDEYNQYINSKSNKQ